MNHANLTAFIRPTCKMCSDVFDAVDIFLTNEPSDCKNIASSEQSQSYYDYETSITNYQLINRN